MCWTLWRDDTVQSTIPRLDRRSLRQYDSLHHYDLLTERPNQPTTKRELMVQVWPDVTVGGGSLRFHIAELRNALDDGKDGARYITALAGRGYCFVAPVSRSSEQHPAPVAAAASFRIFPYSGRKMVTGTER